MTAGEPLSLPAYGWYQYGDALLLRAAGFSSGYAIVERVTGSGPFGAYGVVNDQKTNDGSFIPALSGTQSETKLTFPVLVETGAFESELILTNRGNATATFTLRYVESLSPSKGAGGTTTVDVAAGRQMIIPQAIDFLRSKVFTIGTRGEASYAGSLQVEVTGMSPENVFAGARTSALSPAGGEFGLFYPAFDSSQEASSQAFVLGLKADVNNRSNVAVLHTGADGSGPITLELQVLDGSEGGKAVGQPLSVTLNPGEWAQPSKFFANGGVPNGYVRIRRMAGTAPWYRTEVRMRVKTLDYVTQERCSSSPSALRSPASLTPEPASGRAAGPTAEMSEPSPSIPSTPSHALRRDDSGGVFKSTDSGGTWAAANTGLTIAAPSTPWPLIPRPPPRSTPGRRGGSSSPPTLAAPGPLPTQA